MLTVNGAAFLALLVTLPESHHTQRNLEDIRSRSAADAGR